MADHHNGNAVDPKPANCPFARDVSGQSEAALPKSPIKETDILELTAKARHWTAARLTDKLILLKKLHAQFGYLKQSLEQSRGEACTGIFSFQRMGRRWQSML